MTDTTRHPYSDGSTDIVCWSTLKLLCVIVCVRVFCVWAHTGSDDVSKLSDITPLSF